MTMKSDSRKTDTSTDGARKAITTVDFQDPARAAERGVPLHSAVDLLGVWLCQFCVRRAS